MASNQGDVYQAERILEEKRVRGVRHFLIKWQGWDTAHNTWEPEKNILDRRLIKFFDKNKKESLRSIKDKGKTKRLNKFSKTLTERRMEKLQADQKAKSKKSKADLNDSKSSSGSSVYSLSSTLTSADDESSGKKSPAKPLSRLNRLTSSTSSTSSSSTAQILELSNRLTSKKKPEEPDTSKVPKAAKSTKEEDEEQLRTLKREAEGLRPISKQASNEAGTFKKPKSEPDQQNSKSKTGKTSLETRAPNVKRNHVTYSDDDDHGDEPNNTKENKSKKERKAEKNDKLGFQENSSPDGMAKKSRKDGSSILQKRGSSVDNEEIYSDAEGSVSSDQTSCSSRTSCSTAENKQKNTALQNASNTTYSDNSFDDVVVTDVTSGVVTVTIKECYTPKGFFRN